MNRQHGFATLDGAHAPRDLDDRASGFAGESDDFASQENSEAGGPKAYFTALLLLYPHVVACTVQAVIRNRAGKGSVGHFAG